MSPYPTVVIVTMAHLFSKNNFSENLTYFNRSYESFVRKYFGQGISLVINKRPLFQFKVGGNLKNNNPLELNIWFAQVQFQNNL